MRCCGVGWVVSSRKSSLFFIFSGKGIDSGGGWGRGRSLFPPELYREVSLVENIERCHFFSQAMYEGKVPPKEINNRESPSPPHFSLLVFLLCLCIGCLEENRSMVCSVMEGDE